MSAPRRGSHSVHGASNFAARHQGPLPQPLSPTNRAAAPRAPSLDDAAFAALLEAGAKKVYFVRHAQGEHNASRDSGSSSSYLIPDACLSPLGEQQAKALTTSPAFRSIAGEPALPELVVVSPLRRTMQTAMLAFGTDAELRETPNPEVVLHAGLQETGMTPCDRAQPELGLKLLEGAGWDSLRGEYLSLPEDWHVKGSEWRASVCTRFAALLAWLGTRPERSIAVVSHHDFLKANLCISIEPAGVCALPLDEGGLQGLPGTPSSKGSSPWSSPIAMRLADFVLNRSSRASPLSTPEGSPMSGLSRRGSRTDLNGSKPSADTPTRLAVRVGSTPAGLNRLSLQSPDVSDPAVAPTDPPRLRPRDEA